MGSGRPKAGVRVALGGRGVAIALDRQTFISAREIVQLNCPPLDNDNGTCACPRIRFSLFVFRETRKFSKIPLARILSSSMLFVTFLIYLCFSQCQALRPIWNVGAASRHPPVRHDLAQLCCRAPCCVYWQHVYAPLSSYLFYIYSFHCAANRFAVVRTGSAIRNQQRHIRARPTRRCPKQCALREWFDGNSNIYRQSEACRSSAEPIEEIAELTKNKSKFA